MKPEPRPRTSLTRAVDFLGREKERRSLVERTRRLDPGGAQLWGPRRIGKTWLLDWLYLDWVAAGRPGPLHVQIRCQGLGEPTPLGFFQATFKAIRRASGEAAEFFSGRPLVDAASAGVELLDVVRDLGECGRSIVFLIDEFDKLARAPACDLGFLGQLRCIEQEANAALVVTTSLPLAEVCHEELRSSPLFNVLPPVQVRAFPADDVASALRAWFGTSAEKGVVSESLAQSGGWPMVLAFVAQELEELSLEAVQAVHVALVDELDGDLRQMVNTVELGHPGARGAFTRICSGEVGERAIRSDLRHALDRAGLIRANGRGVEPVWRCAPAIVEKWAVGDRIQAVTDGPPLSWSEWRQLARHSAAGLELTGASAAALERLLGPGDPVSAMQDARHLCGALLEIPGRSWPPVKLLKDDRAVPFEARTNQGARIAHARELARMEPVPVGVDRVFIWQLAQLDAAGNVGAHHGGASITVADAGPLLLVAVEAARRARG